MVLVCGRVGVCLVSVVVIRCIIYQIICNCYSKFNFYVSRFKFLLLGDD